MNKHLEDSWLHDRMPFSDYEWLLAQCKVSTDWQLRQFFVSWKGRLLQDKKQLPVEHRGTPPCSYALGSVPYLGDGTSAGGERLPYSNALPHKPFCAVTAKPGPAPAKFCGLPLGEYRARARPLRQEPEWQLSDLDVEENWRRVDNSALDACPPALMMALANDVVQSLGRWPLVLRSDACPQERRLETRLALVLNAYIAKPMSTHPASEFFAAIECKQRLHALRRAQQGADSAAQPATAVPVDVAVCLQLRLKDMIH